MTARQAFIRYLKNKGLFGPYINFYGVNKIKENLTCNEIFYSLVYFLRNIGASRCWYYARQDASFNTFAENELIIVNKRRLPREGDIVTAKTLDGKYSFDYVVVDYPKPTFGTVNAVSKSQYDKVKEKGSQNVFYGGWVYSTLKLDRICKLNGINVDYDDCYELRDQRVYNVLGNFLR
jgi:hypothetical protein